jgi:hypothetical protein
LAKLQELMQQQEKNEHLQTHHMASRLPIDESTSASADDTSIRVKWSKSNAVTSDEISQIMSRFGAIAGVVVSSKGRRQAIVCFGEMTILDPGAGA